MPSFEEDLCEAQGRSLLLAMRQQLGLGAAYSAFRFAAESEDCAEKLRSAAWDVFGRAIVVALSMPGPKSAGDPSACASHGFGRSDNDAGATTGYGDLSAAAPDLKRHARRIAAKLDLLADAGRAGGRLSAAAVSTIAENLSVEFRDLLRTVERMVSPGPSVSPRSGP